MVILRSGKNVPFLGKNIPKRNQKKTSGRLTPTQVTNASQDSPKSILPRTGNEIESATFNSSKYSQTSTCSEVNSNDSVALVVTSNTNQTIEDESMISDSDQSTMIDDTLELTNYDDSELMDQSNHYCPSMQSHAIEQNHNSRAPYQSGTTNSNIDAKHTTQSNLCSVADLSWF